MGQNFVSVEGNIGSGKSSILRVIAERMPELAILEEPLASWEKAGPNGDVNLLALYYDNPQRWGFTFQIYAFMTRLMRWTEFNKVEDQRVRVSERSLLSDRHVFAAIMKDMGILNEVEYLMYSDCYENLKKMQKIADLKGAIYVKCEPEICSHRIKKRAREGESTIPLDYLAKLHQKHEEWLNSPTQSQIGQGEEVEDLKVLVIDNTEPIDPEAVVERVRKWLEEMK